MEPEPAISRTTPIGCIALSDSAACARGAGFAPGSAAGSKVWNSCLGMSFMVVAFPSENPSAQLTPTRLRSGQPNNDQMNAKIRCASQPMLSDSTTAKRP